MNNNFKIKKFEKLISNSNFFNEAKTVCVKYSDGKIVEYINITNPWKYINSVKKCVNVSDAWIKNE